LAPSHRRAYTRRRQRSFSYRAATSTADTSATASASVLVSYDCGDSTRQPTMIARPPHPQQFTANVPGASERVPYLIGDGNPAEFYRVGQIPPATLHRPAQRAATPNHHYRGKTKPRRIRLYRTSATSAYLVFTSRRHRRSCAPRFAKAFHGQHSRNIEHGITWSSRRVSGGNRLRA